MRKSRLILLWLCGLVGGIGIAAVASAYTSKPARSDGAALYAEVGCAECHGFVGQGGRAGPRLAGKAFTREGFAKQLRHPVDEMPPYSEQVLDAARLARLYDYVSTLR